MAPFAPELTAVYDQLVAYASTGPWAEALVQARADFVARTGELFESDAAFERRLIAFLEWYILDRIPPNSGASAHLAGATPAEAFAQGPGAALPAPQQQALAAWRTASLSLFEVRRVRADSVELDDLLLTQRHTVPASTQLLGLAAKSLLMARVVRLHDQPWLTDGVGYFPAAAAKVVGRVTRAYRRGRVPGVSRLDLLHRLVYLANRCERYRHVEPQRIFAEGEAGVLAPQASL